MNHRQITRLLAALGFATFLSSAALPQEAQGSRPFPGQRDLVQVRATSSVRFDPASGEYVYQYVLQNAAGSRQKLSSFTIVVNGEVSGVTSPRGWSHAPLEDGALLNWTATEADEEGWGDDGGIPPARHAIAPGQRLAGFSFRSRNAPGQAAYFAQGEARLPRLDEVEGHPELPSFDDFRRNGVSGLIAAPKPGCADTGSRCVLDQRYSIRVQWRAPRSGEKKPATSVSIADAELPPETALFRFSAAPSQSVDLAVQVTDGRAVNDHFWLVAGGGSDLEYWIEVRDLQQGRIRSYYNPPGNRCGFEDTRAIPASGELSADLLEIDGSSSAPGASDSSEEWQDDQLIQSPCTRGDLYLCLQGGRFTVDVDWRDPRSGKSGIGRTLSLSGAEDWGAFWLTDPGNVELTVRIVDGRPINGRFWVTYAPLSSSLETSIKVTDRSTGTVRTYHHKAGLLCGASDKEAF
ncbi:MAG TPA: hypothetical protein VKM72_34125 [Thermoanaerobaculia bacterium]|nr:hypothetical protein [Thermoanaerobaculia bacterium]